MYVMGHSKETANVTIPLLGNVYIVDEREQPEYSLEVQCRERNKETKHGQAGKQDCEKD